MEVARPTVVVSPHPFLVTKDRHFEYAEFYPGETLAGYLERRGLQRRFGLDGRRPVVCTIQGLRVPRELWSRVRPKPGYVIEFHAIVRGGGDDSNKIGRTIGLFLVAVASLYFGPIATAYYGSALAGAAVAAGVAVVGGLAVNALFPPPKPHVPQEGDTSPTYSLAGGQNQIRRFEPMPHIIGTHRLFPDFGAQPYNEFRGEDQFSFYVFDLGFNDVDLSEYKLGDTPINNFTGVIIQESGMDGELALFPGNVDTVAGEELTSAISWIQRTSSDDAMQLAVEITGLLFSVTDQGDVASSNVVIEINYRPVGTSTWLTATLQSDEFPVVTGSGWFASIMRMHRDEFLRNLSSSPGQILIVNGNRKPLRRTYAWTVNRDQYEVRVRKVTADSTSSKNIQEISWSQLRTYQPDEADYTGRKRIALQVRATGQISGSLPAFNCVAKAKTLPVGYVYAGVEDQPTVAFDFTQATLAPRMGGSKAVIAITRAGATATRVNSQGYIEVVAADTPRFDYDPLTKLCKGLLIEESSQNICLQSNNFAVTWSGSATVVQNVVGPDGLVSAWTFTDDDVGSYEAKAQSFTVANDSLSHTVSIYVKKDFVATNTVGININLTGGTTVGVLPRLNRASGIATSGVAEDRGDYWRLRAVITNNSSGNTTLTVSFYPATGTNSGSNPGSDVAATTGTAVFTCVQVEKKAEHTSYIPTTTVAVTRNADAPSVLDIGGFYNAAEGSVFVELSTDSSVATDKGGFSFDDGTDNEVVRAFLSTTNIPAAQVRDGGVAQFSTNPAGGAFSVGVAGSIVMAYKANDFAACQRGGTVSTDASGTLPTVTQLRLGVILTSNYLNGHLRKLAYYRKRLANATFQSISANGPAVLERVYTNNPAPWYQEAAQGVFWNGRKVYGGGMPDSLIDFDGLETFEDWCTSEGLTMNAVFDTQVSVFDVLQAIALAGRGTPTWSTGKLGVVWDAPNLPITAVFGMQNIIAGSFEIDYTTEDLADVIEAEFINPDLDWQRDVVRVQVPGTTGMTRVRRLQLFGRTSKTLAAQDANLYAANNAYRNRRYKWISDWEAMPCARGDVVQLSHDLASLDYSGRLVEGSDTTTLKLPKKVPLFGSGAFIVIIKPDGSFGTHSIAAGSGMSDTLTASPALPFNPGTDADHPEYDYRWLYGPTATPGKKVKIESFRPVSENQVEISAIDELPIFYTAKNNPYTYTPPTPVFGVTPVITSLVLTSGGVLVGKGYQVRVTAKWEISGRSSFTDVKVTLGDNFSELHGQNITTNSFDFTITDRQNVTVEITVYSDLGRLGSSAKASVTEFVDFTGSRVPGDISFFTLTGNIFNWEEVPEIDVVGYQIRFHLGDKRTWEDASPMHEGVITEHEWAAETLPLDDQIVTYLVKAVDAAGQYSENAAYIVRGIGDPLIANVLETVDHRSLGWPGTITGGTIQSGDVVANTTTLFYSGVDTDPLYTNDSAPMYPPDTYVALEYVAPVFAPAAPLQGSVITIQHVMQGEPHYLDWRQDGIGPLYGPDDSALFYTGDTDLMYDVGNYIPWTGARVIEHGDRFQFRMRAGQGAIQGKFLELLLTVDAPDVEEELNNVNISASGTRLPITMNFTSIKSVQGTLEFDGGTAVTMTIEDRDPDLGPLIKTRNSSGTAVAGRGDFRVKGW